MHWAQRRGKGASETELQVWDLETESLLRTIWLAKVFLDLRRKRNWEVKCHISQRSLTFSFCRKKYYICSRFSHFFIWQLRYWHPEGSCLLDVYLSRKHLPSIYCAFGTFLSHGKYSEESQVPAIMYWYPHYEERTINKEANAFKSNTQLQVQKKKRMSQEMN